MNRLKNLAMLVCSFALTSITLEGAGKTTLQQQGSGFKAFKILFRKYWQDINAQVYFLQHVNSLKFQIYYLGLQSKEATDPSLVASLEEQITKQTALQNGPLTSINSDAAQASRESRLAAIQSNSFYLSNKSTIDPLFDKSQEILSTTLAQINQQLATLTSDPDKPVSSFRITDYSTSTNPIMSLFMQSCQEFLRSTVVFTQAPDGSTQSTLKSVVRDLV